MTATDYITILSNAGGPAGELLIEFMEQKRIAGLRYANADDLREFCESKGLLGGDSYDNI